MESTNSNLTSPSKKTSAYATNFRKITLKSLNKISIETSKQTINCHNLNFIKNTPRILGLNH